ncbi:hypothetical protein [Sinorhizobium psoraleae]|uniref:Uncharacterized protein n=1 Tax=Sinorhizobium psoraleae TaxID=520838 RepID=A0ABT4KBU8_9HYPH|nr:hypothetical protein [Sinorhizobium psoraleae]MCZ4088831.1 hypothetical protein [Sinorhizobium psoraleae]
MDEDRGSGRTAGDECSILQSSHYRKKLREEKSFSGPDRDSEMASRITAPGNQAAKAGEEEG